MLLEEGVTYPASSEACLGDVKYCTTDEAAYRDLLCTQAPRCLYLRDGIQTGYWTSPYFDAGAGNINMVTFSQPIISKSGKFLGVVTSKIMQRELLELCESFLHIHKFVLHIFQLM